MSSALDRRSFLTTCRYCGGTGSERDDEQVGHLVRAKREERGLSLRELARRAKCSAPFLSDLERGHRPWSAPAARRVLKILKIRLPEGL